MKRLLKSGLIFILAAGVLIGLQSLSASAMADSSDSDMSGSASQLSYGYIPGKIHGANAVTNAYLRGDMETYYRLSGKGTADPMSEKASLPSSYDSRSYGYVTSVKNQNPYGSCWAHAAMACVESYMIKEGVPVDSGAAATTGLNLSETQHCFFNYSSAYDAEGMTAGDKSTLTGSDGCLDAGGNGEMSAYTLMHWTGAADESVSALQYSKASTVARSGLNSQYAYGSNVSHVQNSEWIPAADIEAVKEAIMKYGAGNISYYETGRAYTYICTIDKTSQDSSSHKWANHAITVVGWDDSIAASKFSPNKPSTNGAWICKNSWGTGYFSSGYCYISYADTSVLDGYIYFYDAEPIDNYDHNYQYDGSCNVVCYGKGWPGSEEYYVGFANNTKVANVFTAKGNESLKAVGFCSWDEGMSYTVDIYKNPKAGNPSSGTLMSTQTGSLTFSGYYTIELDDPVDLSAGDTFAVVFTQNVPEPDENGKYVHTPYDATFNRSDVVSWCAWTHADHGSTSYYREPNGAWTDCPDNGDYRIKAYTVDVDHIHSYGNWTSNNNGTHSKVCSECQNTVTENCSFRSTVTQPTAAEQGYTTHTCAVCGYSYTDSFTAPLGYTVSFSVPAGLTAPASVSCQAGESVALPAAPAPAGYSFLGWTVNTCDHVTEAPSYFSGSYSPSGNITLKALYSFSDASGSGFQLLTSAPDSWEGSYVITYGKSASDMVVLKGLSGKRKYESQSAGGAAALAESGMTLNGFVLKGVSSIYTFRISSADGRFVIRNEATGTYLASRGGYLYTYKKNSAAYCRWTLSMNGESTDASNGASSKLPHLSFSAGKQYFMVNRTADTGIYFWKLSSSTVTVYTTEIN